MAFKFDRSSRMTASPTVKVGISVCISAITAGASLPLTAVSASSSAPGARMYCDARKLCVSADAATDMHRDIGTEQMRLLRKDDSRLDRVAEVFRDGVVERLRDVGPQRLSDVDVLTFDCQIHVLCPTDGCNAAQLSSWPFGLST